MKTIEEVKRQIEELNIPDGAVVLVHTSLRAVGKIEGGGETLLSLLIENITSRGGILCLPTHTWDKLGRDCLTLDPSRKETCLGAFPTIALAHPRGIRSYNPSHSAVAFGDPTRIKELFADELCQSTPTSPTGFYGKLLNESGYILLLGVGQNSNTYLHAVEELLSIPDRVAKDTTRVSAKMEDGSVVYRDMYMFEHRVHGDVSHKFYMYEPAFRYHGAIADGTIGDASVQLCSCKKMTEALKIMVDRAPTHDPLTLGDTIPESLYV